LSSRILTSLSIRAYYFSVETTGQLQTWNTQALANPFKKSFEFESFL